MNTKGAGKYFFVITFLHLIIIYIFGIVDFLILPMVVSLICGACCMKIHENTINTNLIECYKNMKKSYKSMLILSVVYLLLTMFFLAIFPFTPSLAITGEPGYFDLTFPLLNLFMILISLIGFIYTYTWTHKYFKARPFFSVDDKNVLIYMVDMHYTKSIYNGCYIYVSNNALFFKESCALVPIANILGIYQRPLDADKYYIYIELTDKNIYRLTSHNYLDYQLLEKFADNNPHLFNSEIVFKVLKNN